MKERTDPPRTSWTSLDAIRVSLGAIYFHFGFLKFFPDLSPAEVMAGYTAMKLTGFHMQAAGALWWIAILECAIGLGFLFKVCMRCAGALFGLHMAATFLPLILLPEFTFKFAPFAPSMEGQYILKNVVLVTAGWAVLEPHFRNVESASVSPTIPVAAADGSPQTETA